jgi:hypothetical protein
MKNNPGPPMTLPNMRANGVRAVTATCEACRREADVNVDALPETVTVPKAGQRLRCSSCGGKTISTRPAWHTAKRSGVQFHEAASLREPIRFIGLQSFLPPVPPAEGTGGKDALGILPRARPASLGRVSLPHATRNDAP